MMAGIVGAGETQDFYANIEGSRSLSLKFSFALLFNFEIIQLFKV